VLLKTLYGKMNKIAKIAIHKEAGLNIRNTEGIEFKGK
jgi:hypothetical protein